MNEQKVASAKLTGIGVGSIGAWGRVFTITANPKQREETKSLLSPSAERQRLQSGIDQLIAEMRLLAESSSGEAKEIIEALVALADDPALVEEADVYMKEGFDAETSLLKAMGDFTKLLEGDALFAERIPDLTDLAWQIVLEISGERKALEIPSVGPIIIVAEDLSPSQTSTFTRAVVGVITSGGGPTSHTAIICRQLNIPALVATKGDFDSLKNGLGVVLDAYRSEAYLSEEDPKNFGQQVRRARTGPAIAEVKGNIGSIDDLDRLAKTEAHGVGLMRTELLFLARETAPTFEEQVELYSKILRDAPAGEVIFRTLDAGSDKPLPYLKLGSEENPSLGVRGFRLNNLDPNLLQVQLRALYTAQQNVQRDVSVMAPMIATVQEAKEFASLARDCGISKVGIMVETPSICLVIEQLEDLVDFISIGTNDLSQYLFAADRQNSQVAELLNPWQPALLIAIQRICQDARKASIKVGVCGEAGSDPLLAVVLAGLGVDSVSMASSAVEVVTDYLSSVSLVDAEAIAKAALLGATASQSKEFAIAQLEGLLN